MARSTIFAPPRNRPKISLSQPSVTVGQPMPQMQQIPEPVDFVGRYTGMVHGTAGDNPNGPEHVQITPTGGPGKPTVASDGGPSYAQGGSFLVGASNPDPQPQEVQSEGSGGSYNPYPSTIGTGIFSGHWSPYSNSYPSTIGTGMFSPSWQAPQGHPVYGDPNQNIWQLQQNLFNARNSGLNLQANVLDQRMRNLPLQSAVYDAQGNLISMQGAQNQARAGYLRQEGGVEQQRLSEAQAINAARFNTPDLTRAAEAEGAYAAENRRDAAMGVAPPAEINLPNGTTTPAVAGVRPKIKTQEQQLKENQSYAEPIRAQQLALARNAVDLMGTDVESARLAAARAGLTLDQANQLVTEAQLQEGYGNIISSRANLELEQAQQPPQPGMVRWTDPATGAGEWVTPQEHDELQYNYTQARGAQRYEQTALGAFSSGFIRNLVRYGQISDEAAIAGLMAGGRGRPPMTREQAQDEVNLAHTGSRGSSVQSLPPPSAGSPPAQTLPAPAAAPSGQNPALSQYRVQ